MTFKTGSKEKVKNNYVDPDYPKKTLAQQIVVQGNSGKISVKDIQELKSVVET